MCFYSQPLFMPALRWELIPSDCQPNTRHPTKAPYTTPRASSRSRVRFSCRPFVPWRRDDLIPKATLSPGTQRHIRQLIPQLYKSKMRWNSFVPVHHEQSSLWMSSCSPGVSQVNSEARNIVDERMQMQMWMYEQSSMLSFCAYLQVGMHD